jgi:hypothetical protein
VRRTLPALLATFAALAVAVAGCGVPNSSDPEVVGRAPGFGPVPRADVRVPVPDGAAGPQPLVERFLQAAAAGDWDTAGREQRVQRAAEHARTFLSPEFANNWQPGNTQIVVVDVTSMTPGVDYVDVTMRPVGVLKDYGILDSLPTGTDISGLSSFKFKVDGSGPGGELRIATAPGSVLLSTAGLRELFDVRPVYFWDLQNRTLVPDRRYLARGLSPDKRAREIVDRLRVGPSDFLASTVNPLPANTSTDNPVLQSNKIIVNLSETVPTNDPQLLRRIASQLRWSLHPETVPLELQIAGRSQGTFAGTEYLADNAAQAALGSNPALPLNEQDRLYGVVNGQVVAASTQNPPAILASPQNNQVVAAAMRGNPDRAEVALVRQIDGKPELWLGRFRGDTEGAQFVRAAMPAVKTMSRPSFLHTGERVLVAADGELYDVDPSGRAQQVAGLAPELRGARAVSVSPDGTRVAIVTAQRVLVATLDTSAPTAKLVRIRALDTPGLTLLRAVAWSYEHQLVVAGGDRLVEVSIDNGSYMSITPENLGTLEITHVASLPVPVQPNRDTTRGPTVIEAGSLGYYAYSQMLPITTRSVPAPSAAPTPSRSPSAPTAPPPLRAPFFIE